MADEVDATQARIELEQELILRDVSNRASQIDKGVPGECYYCGEFFQRVVFVNTVDEYCCARCRDLRKLD